MEGNINRSRLFVASCLALLVTSLTFAIRAKIEGVFSVDYGLSKEDIGYAFGPAFWGFAIAMFLGGYIIDYVKTKRIVWLAFVLHFIGIILLLLSRDKTSLLIANVFIGLGNGSVEAACNPLVASMYTEDKTKMLNRFHVWFPGGLVVGGLLSFLLMDTMNLPWQVLVSLLFIPLLIYGYLFFGQKIPETERVTSGISYRDMMKNLAAPFTITGAVLIMILIASVPSLSVDFQSNTPYYIIGVIVLLVIIEGRVLNKVSLVFPFVLFCMLLSASIELGTGQWINALLTNAGVAPMIILVVVSGIMAIGRFFAGGVVHRLNPTGVLIGSAIISSLGLILLSNSSGPAMTLASAAVFGIGVCYFWPTMIGVASEYIPGSGALGMSVLGGAGFVATAMILPIMGKSIESAGPETTLRNMAVLPAILIVCYIVLYVVIRKRNT